MIGLPKARSRLFDPERRRRGIYLLPNLFTTAALFAGFFAIVQGMNGKFETACIAIFVAMVLDGLDGRVARLTNTQSEFGAEYDSLSDMVSFGAAPALLMYEWALKPMGRWGWIAAFIYCGAAAVRLARFNTNLDVVDKRYFQGLPSPAAAALVAGMIWVLNDYQVHGGDVRGYAWALTVFAGITMVSNVKFYSGKDINLKKAVPFWVVPAILVGFLLVSIDPSHVLWGLFVAYALSGYLMWLVRRLGPAAPEVERLGPVTLMGLRNHPDDLDLLAKWLSKEEVREFFGGKQSPYTIEAIKEKFLPRARGDSGFLATIVRYDEQPIGYLQLYPLRDDPDGALAEHGLDHASEKIYAIDLFIGDHARWGKGAGAWAVKAAVVHAVDELDATLIVADPRIENERAIRCYEKCGFVKLRQIARHEFVDGEWRDCWLMALHDENALRG